MNLAKTTYPLKSFVHPLCDINGLNIQLQCKRVDYSKINIIIDNSKRALIPHFEWIEQVFGLAPLLLHHLMLFTHIRPKICFNCTINIYLFILIEIFCMECIAFQYVSSKSYLSSCRCSNGRWPREGGRPKKTALNILLFPKCFSFCSTGVRQSLPLVTDCHITYLFISEIYITTFFRT